MLKKLEKKSRGKQGKIGRKILPKNPLEHRNFEDIFFCLSDSLGFFLIFFKLHLIFPLLNFSGGWARGKSVNNVGETKLSIVLKKLN